MDRNSILQFCQKGIVKLEEKTADFFENPRDIAKYIGSVKEEFLKTALEFVGESFSELDEMIRNSVERKKNWEIVRRDDKSLLTSLGEVNFEKTLFKHKRTGERCYLVDCVMDLEENIRITEDAEAKILEEAVQTSYRRGGQAASLSIGVTKETVKNLIHGLEFPSHVAPDVKKKVKYLYIDADEDHVAKQGRLDGMDERSHLQPKLVYVYEGIRPEAPESKRYQLINPFYFSGMYEGKENRTLWEEIDAYIESTYDTSNVEKIYLNADGGSWIKEGKTAVAGLITVLDEYHINQYLTRMCTHLYNSASDGRDILRACIRQGTKSEFLEIAEWFTSYTEDNQVKARIFKAAMYILNNWSAAKLRLRRKDGVIGSSTEGHVSHVLAARMSSRPMGWCVIGADKMAHLRAYSWNKGDMLELIRHQKKARKRAHQDTENLLTVHDINRMINLNAEGKYYDKLQHSLPAQGRKILAIREHLISI